MLSTANLCVRLSKVFRIWSLFYLPICHVFIGHAIKFNLCSELGDIFKLNRGRNYSIRHALLNNLVNFKSFLQIRWNVWIEFSYYELFIFPLFVNHAINSKALLYTSLIFKWNDADAMNRSLSVGLNHVINSNLCFGSNNVFEENYTMNYSFFSVFPNYGLNWYSSVTDNRIFE